MVVGFVVNPTTIPIYIYAISAFTTDVVSSNLDQDKVFFFFIVPHYMLQGSV
jgi:hypothetical protein